MNPVCVFYAKTQSNYMYGMTEWLLLNKAFSIGICKLYMYMPKPMQSEICSDAM